MKILQINANIGTGSVGRIVTDIYDGLYKSGYRSKVAYGRGYAHGISQADAICIGNSLTVNLHGLFSRLTDRSGFFFRSTTRKLIEKIDLYQPDVIHMHGNYGYYINIEELFESLAVRNIPIVNTLHSCWDFTGHCCYFDTVKCDKWQKICYKCPQIKSYPTSWFVDNSMRNYQDKKRLLTSIDKMVIVTPSNWMADLARKSFLSKYPIKVIHNGVDQNVFKPSVGGVEKYGNGKEIILGIASVWDERKGLSDFIELSQILPKKYQIVLVGVPKEQEKKIPREIMTIHRTNNIAELSDIYSAATILFNPTYEDNYPTVNLEALSCGTPVVTYNTGGSPEAIVNDMCGMVIKKKDYDMLLRYLRDMPKGYKINKKMFSCWGKERMVKKYIDLYKELV